MIRKIYEVDPLLCPECGNAMKIIAFIEAAAVIRKILEHLRLWEEPEPRAPAPLSARHLNVISGSHTRGCPSRCDS